MAEETEKPVKEKKKKRGRPKQRKKPGPKVGSLNVQPPNRKRSDVPTDGHGRPWYPSTTQIEMAQLLLDFDDKRSKTEKCKEIGITRATLNNWEKDSNFVGWLHDTLKMTVVGELAEMYRYLKSACKRGNVQAIRLWFELAGCLSNTQKVELTGKDGQPIQTSSNIQIVFGSGSGMAEPPGKREIIDVEGSEIVDVESEEVQESDVV